MSNTTDHTKLSIRSLLETNDQAVARGIVAIFNNQTTAEQDSETTHVLNGIGFSAFDAEILSSFAKQVNAGRTLSAKQITLGRKKILKYSGQLLQIVEAGRIQ